MAVQRLHAFEKTSIQARHTMKRLEAVIDNPRSTEIEKNIASQLLIHFKTIRNTIPFEFMDIDLDRE
jgi:hypothetical protein